MLILTRDLDETIRIGDDITVQVVSINRFEVRLGITAPKDLRVLCSELIEGDWPPVDDPLEADD